MRGIVTICQNKRVALPFIFGKYVYPEMQRRFHGDLTLYHVWHDAHSTDGAMASNRELGEDKLANVRKFIHEQRYSNAIIERVTTTSEAWPALESMKCALRRSKALKADFHLWMEDDAIVVDMSCDTWATQIGGGDVGLYTNTDHKQMINIAYFLSTREYDDRLLNILNEYRGNKIHLRDTGLTDNFKGKGSMIEHIFWRAARKPVFLGPCKMFRHHPHGVHQKTGTDVKNWLKTNVSHVCPVDMDLLKLDFPD